MSENTSELYTQLQDLLLKYADLFGELENTEALKYQGAKTFDLQALNAGMKEEQVFIMTLKGYEQKRLSLFKALAIPEKTPLSRLPKILPPDRGAEFEEPAGRLLRAYEHFLPIYEKAHSILEVNAHILDRDIQALEENAAPGTPYKQDGSYENQSFHTLKNMQI